MAISREPDPTITSLRDSFTIDKESYQDMDDAMHVQTEDELLREDWLDNYANDVVKQQNHLTSAQKRDLLELLTKHLTRSTLNEYCVGTAMLKNTCQNIVRLAITWRIISEG